MSKEDNVVYLKDLTPWENEIIKCEDCQREFNQSNQIHVCVKHPKSEIECWWITAPKDVAQPYIRVILEDGVFYEEFDYFAFCKDVKGYCHPEKKLKKM
jgi:hypothetical protein